jgi:hypothetical protein
MGIHLEDVQSLVGSEGQDREREKPGEHSDGASPSLTGTRGHDSASAANVGNSSASLS